MKKTAAAGAGLLVGGIGWNELSPHLIPEKMVFEPNSSFWAQYPIPQEPPLAEDLEADVAIIGGGYFGLSCAYHMKLLNPQRRIVVLEAVTCGSGASGRNGGMLLPFPANEYFHIDSDPGMHKRLYDLTVANMKELQQVGSLQGMDCGFDLRGHALALTTREKVEEAKSYAEKARELGMATELWDKQKAASELGTSFYEGALYDPNGGQLHPMKWLHALKTAALRSGVRVFENTPVSAIHEGSTVELGIAGGRIVKTRSLVLASNAFTSKLGYFRNAIAPLRSYLATTPVLGDDVISAIGWKSRVPYSDSKTLLHYAAISQDNRVRFGGGYVDYAFNNGVLNTADASKSFLALHEEMARRYAALAAVPFEHTWSGLVDMTLDNKPFAGATGKDQNIYYGLGFCGHGVNLTFLFGRIVADLESGRGSEWTGWPFVGNKPPYIANEPFRWLGIHGEVAYYRVTGS